MNWLLPIRTVTNIPIPTSASGCSTIRQARLILMGLCVPCGGSSVFLISLRSPSSFLLSWLPSGLLAHRQASNSLAKHPL